MRINNNLMAMNTHRQLGINANNGAKSIEKLSSGYRINRAGDDAAGLAISEKMRGQIRGLTQASRNAQDGISMIQTAEGALNESHAILQRMRELAVQSATDTNTSDDRLKLQSEVDQLAKELTRISNTTEFNTKNLLAGGLDNTFHIGANADQSVDLAIGAMDAKSLGVAGNIVTTSFAGGELAQTGITSVSTQSEGLNGKFIAAIETAATYTANTGSLAGALTNNASAYTGTTNKTFSVQVAAVAASEVTQLNYSTDGGVSFKAATWTAAGQFTLEDGVSIDIASNAGLAIGQAGSIAVTPDKLTFRLTSDDAATTAIGASVDVFRGATSVTIGDDANDTAITVNFDFAAVQGAVGTAWDAADSTAITQTLQSSTAAVVGSDGNITAEAVTYGGVKVTTQAKANLAITTINSALENVSGERSKLGAMQNRLEHTIKNLDTSAENLQASESRIRDVDMAKEMMNFTKNNILQQAAQAMLAQANQAPQGVLQLLR